MDPLLDPHGTHIRSFVAGRTRGTPAQQRALDTLVQRYGWAPHRTGPSFDQLAAGAKAVTLDIGFGNGETLLRLAETEPSTVFIGVETYRPGLGQAMLRLAEAKLDNVRLVWGDAVVLLRDHVPADRLDRILILFPDPWPKRRHHKRRLLQPAFAELATSRLKPGGAMYLATDLRDYAEHMLATLDATPGLCNAAGLGRFAERPRLRPPTRFEARGLRLGQPPLDLIYRRRQTEQPAMPLEDAPKHRSPEHPPTGPICTVIAGTDTGVGKTRVACALAQHWHASGHRVGVRKPMESGCTETWAEATRAESVTPPTTLATGALIPADAVALRAAAGAREDLTTICPHRLRAAISPERAARLAGLALTIHDLAEACAMPGADRGLVEGAGGLYSPLAEDGLNADLAQALGWPVVVVAVDRLGCLNHVLLATEAIAQRGLRLACVVLNAGIEPPRTPEEAEMDNLHDLRARLDVPVIPFPELSAHTGAGHALGQACQAIASAIERAHQTP